MYCFSAAQKEAAESLVAELDRSGRFADPVVTEIVAAGAFYPAEAYHQQYLAKNPGGYCHVNLALAAKPL